LDRELVVQHEDLDILGTVRATVQHHEVEYGADKTLETGHTPILAASEPRRSQQRETAGHHPRLNCRHRQVVIVAVAVMVQLGSG